MSTVKLKEATKNKTTVNFHNNLDKSGETGYESDVTFSQNDADGWVAEIVIDGMPDQYSPEDAADKLSSYLLAMSKAVKGRNIKHLNIGNMFTPVHKK